MLKILCLLFKMFVTDTRKEFYDVVVNQVSFNACFTDRLEVTSARAPGHRANRLFR